MRILASGVFDILHPGHVFYLETAKKLGDYLVVVVTSDGHATRTKRQPLHSAEERAALVSALKVVDEVTIGADPYDLATTTRQARPDIVALGHDQKFDEWELAKALATHGFRIEVVRLPQHPTCRDTTTDILYKV